MNVNWPRTVTVDALKMKCASIQKVLASVNVLWDFIQMEQAVSVRDIHISDVKLQFILIGLSNIIIRQVFQTLYILSNPTVINQKFKYSPKKIRLEQYSCEISHKVYPMFIYNTKINARCIGFNKGKRVVNIYRQILLP